MKFTVFLSICLTAVSAASFLETDVVGEWGMWKSTHGKTYNDIDEEINRITIFMENKAKIAEHNSRAAQGKHGYVMEMNQFGDLSHHEFVNMMNGYKKAQKSKKAGRTFLTPMNLGKLPKNVDWRNHGYVTPVKSQESCGSCWAFSATGALEGQHFRKTGKLISLSEQNLVDCSTSYGNNGCSGGWMDYAFEYIKDNEGIDTEKSYPYEAIDGRCRYKKKNKGATDAGVVNVPEGNEKKLKEAIATVGPLSVAIDASGENFQFYSKGVYDEPSCSSDVLDHGVLAIGYGVESGQEYWLVKNSWSETWGDNGYIKMARNKNNMCGIATAASYPLV